MCLSDGSCLSAAAEWLEWEMRGGSGPNTGAGAEIKRVVGVETLLLALKPHTNYTIQVLAYTTAGDGVPAHPIPCTTQQDGMSFLNKVLQYFSRCSVITYSYSNEQLLRQ